MAPVRIGFRVPRGLHPRRDPAVPCVYCQPAGDEERLADDLLVIPVPGHTRGSSALLYRDTALFAGDHLCQWSERPGRLHTSRGVCLYSWTEQKRSVTSLLAADFEWVLPGHGRRFHACSVESMRAELERLVESL